MFSNSLHRIKSSAYSVNVILVLILVVIISIPFPTTSVSLPDKIGRLNDYANILTMAGQRELKEKIDRLSDKNLGLTVLLSTRDPYQNPDIFASKIRANWDLRGNQAENFLTFVREQEGWAVRTFFSSTLLNLFSSVELKKFQETLRKKANSGEIRSGTFYAVNTIYEKAFPPKKESNEAVNQPGLPLNYIIIGGIIGGILLLILIIRWEAMRRCPRCGARLNKSRARTGLTEVDEKNCPECGYIERS
ncbi:MAG: hypothetical protein ABEJ25_07890 [Candidatus Bipolaricaulia bacterium]